MATVNKNLSVYDKTVFLKRNIFVLGRCFWMEWSYNWRVIQWAEQAFLENKVPEHIIRWNVPGSFELIYGCKKCFKLKT
jgi:6,7-dimethyl-8-ribityllumazine synthase